MIRTLTPTELNLSLKSRSFLHRVNDRVRKILDHSSKDAMQDIDKHSLFWWMFMSSTLEASIFMGKNYSENLHSIKKTGNSLTLKQMFDIWKVDSRNNQMRFLECLKSARKVLHGKSYLWSMMKKSSVSRMQRFIVFSDSVFCLGKVNQNPTSNTVWEQQLGWFNDSSQYRTLDTIDGEPMEFEWNIFPGFSTLELVREVQKFMNKMSEPEQSQGRIIFMSMLNDITWWNKDNETECIANSTIVSLFAKKNFHQDVGHSSDLCQKQSGTPPTKKDHEENGTESLNWWWSGSEKADTQFSEPRVHCPEERSKAKEVENYQHTSVPMVIRLKLFFAPSFSVNQLSI